ncbi:hypothetical protein B296_00035594 [Ensete ventricosum]|uniref:Uncharacterized protein n=1 Tax=Ensete ventricosum TaxID=4639 RepID=A0A426ZK66_ENSVE|nr:hypothetical protein B296_00035594 [Ensete ventricosum]
MCTSCSLRLLWKRTSAGHLKTKEEALTREGAFCHSGSGVLSAEFDSAEEGTSEVETAGGKHGRRQGPSVAQKGVQANSSWAVMCHDPTFPCNHQLNLGLLINLGVSGMNWLGGRKGDRSRLRFRVDSLRFRLLLVLQFEGVMETGKDFDGSGLRLGRKV